MITNEFELRWAKMTGCFSNDLGTRALATTVLVNKYGESETAKHMGVDKEQVRQLLLRHRTNKCKGR